MKINEEAPTYTQCLFFFNTVSLALPVGGGQIKSLLINEKKFIYFPILENIKIFCNAREATSSFVNAKANYYEVDAL